MRDLMHVVALLDQGRVKLAEAECRAALAQSPGHPVARFLLALCAVKRGATSEAVKLLEGVIADAPDFTDAHERLGALYVQAGRLGDAIARFEDVARRAPGFAAVHAKLAAARMRAERFDAAAEAFREAVRLAPEDALLHKRLGDALWLAGRVDESFEPHLNAAVRWTGPVDPVFFEHVWRTQSTRGRMAEARRVAKRWLDLDPKSELAAHSLAASGGAMAPSRASDGTVVATFDAFANSFDEQLATVGYRTPEVVARLLAAERSEPAGELLDAGCGTGLCGPLVRARAQRLVGVDLSPRMLDKARARGGYDELHAAELTTFLEGAPGRFDAIICADTVVYFGDLARLVAAFASALAPCGTVVLSAETRLGAEGRDPGFDLLPSGRYSHDRAYVERLAREAGLVVGAVEEVTLRTENGVPVRGFVLAARRPS